MNIVQKSRSVGLSIGLIAAAGVLAPISASAAALYASDYPGSTIYKFEPDGSKTTFATGIQTPYGIAFDASGNLFVANHNPSTITKITSSGIKTTFATLLQSPNNLAFDASGNLFLAVRQVNWVIERFTPSGVGGAFASKRTDFSDLAFDENGNLFASSLADDSIYKFTPGGVKTIFATGLNSIGLAFAPSASSTAVPEPFTIIGTLIGGTAALRLRKKLKSSGKV